MKKRVIMLGAIILLIVVLMLLTINYSKANEPFVIRTIMELDMAKGRVMTTGEIPNYDKYVGDSRLKEFYELRDNYNLLWLNKSENKVHNLYIGHRGYKVLALFDRCFVIYSANNNIIDSSEPARNEAVNYNRFLILKRVGSTWLVVTDISKFDGSIKLVEMFDKTYLDNKILEYTQMIDDMNE